MKTYTEAIKASAALLASCLVLSACNEGGFKTKLGDENNSSQCPATALTAMNAPFALGIPQKHSANPHNFSMNGTTWYPVGFYPGVAFNMNDAGFGTNFSGRNREVLDLLSNNRVNYTRVWINWGAVTHSSADWDENILTPYPRTGPGNALDGKPKLDLSKWNQAYFDLLTEFVDYANTKGIVLQIILLDCWHVGQYGQSNGYLERDFYHSGNNINGVSFSDRNQWTDPNGPLINRHKDFIRKVIDTVGNRPNIVWESCNENFNNFPVFDNAIANFVTQYETSKGLATHLVVPRDLPEHRSVGGHKPFMVSPEKTHSDLLLGPGSLVGYNDDKILITDNDCCAGEPESNYVRKKAWAALTAGAHINMFNNDAVKKPILRNANTRDSVKYLGFVAKFVSDYAVDMARLTPHDELVSGGAWALARPGKEFIIYLMNGGSTTVSNLPSMIEAHWYNPKNGASQNAGNGPTFTAPAGGDWVLYIREAGPTTTTTTTTSTSTTTLGPPGSSSTSTTTTTRLPPCP